MDYEGLPCEFCGLHGANVSFRHRGCAYNDPASNESIACDECQAKDNAYWAERWSDYYAGCL